MDLDVEKFEKELKIDNASMFSLERELLSHSKKVADYRRWYAQAVKRVDVLTISVETIAAEIFDGLLKKEEKEKGKSVPVYAMSYIQKKIPLDKRYVRAKIRLADAREVSNTLKGFVKAFESRGYRLKELVRLSEQIMLPEPRVYREGVRFGEKSLEAKMEEAGEKLD